MAVATGWYSVWTSSGTSSVTGSTNEQVADDTYSGYIADGANMYTRGYPILPGHATITGIEIEIHAKAASGSDPDDYFEVDLSWNAGTNYTTAKRVPPSGGLGSTENVYTLGGPTDDWGHTWTLAEITSATNFRIRRTYNKVTADGNIDLLRIRVYHELPQAGTLEIPVTSGDDDGYENAGAWNSATTGAGFGDLGGAEDFIYFGAAFRNITIPAGSTITSAYLVVANEPASANYAILCKILGVDVDDFGVFDNVSNKPTDYISGSPTTAQVDWDLTTGDVWDASLYYASPDIKTIIQEIIDRGGWASGNDIGLIVKDDGGEDYRTIATWDFEQPPVLVINFVAASDERGARLIGQVDITAEREAMAAGGDGRYVENFSTTTKKDTGNTDANWPGDGTARMSTS